MSGHFENIQYMVNRICSMTVILSRLRQLPYQIDFSIHHYPEWQLLSLDLTFYDLTYSDINRSYILGFDVLGYKFFHWGFVQLIEIYFFTNRNSININSDSNVQTFPILINDTGWLNSSEYIELDLVGTTHRTWFSRYNT